jgi:hypothetical protein
MHIEKNIIIVLTLVLVGLFSTAADARIRGDQIDPMTISFLTTAAGDYKTALQQCVRDNFLEKSKGQRPPLLDEFYQTMFQASAAGLVNDDVTFKIAADDILKQACGDNQMAGGGKKSK